jgi:hypothetical protein
MRGRAAPEISTQAPPPVVVRNKLADTPTKYVLHVASDGAKATARAAYPSTRGLGLLSVQPAAALVVLQTPMLPATRMSGLLGHTA